MDQKNSIPLLPPPSVPEELETAEDENRDQTLQEENGEKTIQPTEDAPPELPADDPAGTSPMRLMLRVGMILLGLFSAVIFVTTAITGTDRLAALGMDRLILGELFGGSANIGIIPREEDKAPLSPPLNITSPPANEQESAETASPLSPPLESMGEIAIIPADLSAKGDHGLSLINETPYSPALVPQSDRVIPTLSELYSRYGADAPVVLILHTHATESFAEKGASFTSEAEYRSLDPEENILAVGRALAEVLRARGINVIHCEEMFDAEDFTMAYYNASLTIRRLLSEYPSISYILDLHRDSIPYSGGEGTVRPIFEKNGMSYAQMMFVVGTDHGGSGHTGWRDNLNLACRLQNSITRDFGNLMRPINLRSASFNQQYTKGSLLIEMGAMGSCIEEAENSARILGEALADEILGPGREEHIGQLRQKENLIEQR